MNAGRKATQAGAFAQFMAQLHRLGNATLR